MISWLVVFGGSMLTGFLMLLIVSAFLYLAYDLKYRAWVETKREVARQMVELADIGAGDNVYDLGCGDGRILIEAAKLRRTAPNSTPNYAEQQRLVGLEVNPVVALIARLKVRFAGVANCVSIARKNFFNENVQGADVVFLYLFPEMLARAEHKLKKELRPGTRIVSNTFPLKQFRFVKAHPENKNVRLYVA